MATSQSTVDFLLDQLTGQGMFSVRKMFGEYCLYLAGAPWAWCVMTSCFSGTIRRCAP